MYERYAKDLSEGLFNSVYSSLFEIADKEQQSIFASLKKRQKMYAGEAQEMLNAFCHGRLSLGDCLNFIERKHLTPL